MTLETSIMIVRFLLQNKMRAEALTLLNDAIYISNLQIDEIHKIRRYHEIGNFYAESGLRRLATLYKWISVGRIFVLKKNLESSQGVLVAEDLSLKCLVTRCTNQMIALFDELKIFEQKSPSALAQIENFELYQIGFPIAKKYLVTQIVELLLFSRCGKEATKFLRYVLHEMHQHLSEPDFSYCL